MCNGGAGASSLMVGVGVGIGGFVVSASSSNYLERNSCSFMSLLSLLLLFHRKNGKQNGGSRIGIAREYNKRRSFSFSDSSLPLREAHTNAQGGLYWDGWNL